MFHIPPLALRFFVEYRKEWRPNIGAVTSLQGAHSKNTQDISSQITTIELWGKPRSSWLFTSIYDAPVLDSSPAACGPTRSAYFVIFAVIALSAFMAVSAYSDFSAKVAVCAIRAFTAFSAPFAFTEDLAHLAVLVIMTNLADSEPWHISATRPPSPPSPLRGSSWRPNSRIAPSLPHASVTCFGERPGARVAQSNSAFSAFRAYIA